MERPKKKEITELDLFCDTVYTYQDIGHNKAVEEYDKFIKWVIEPIQKAREKYIEASSMLTQKELWNLTKDLNRGIMDSIERYKGD